MWRVITRTALIERVHSRVSHSLAALKWSRTVCFTALYLVLHVKKAERKREKKLSHCQSSFSSFSFIESLFRSLLNDAYLHLRYLLRVVSFAWWWWKVEWRSQLKRVFLRVIDLFVWQKVISVFSLFMGLQSTTVSISSPNKLTQNPKCPIQLNIAIIASAYR